VAVSRVIAVVSLLCCVWGVQAGPERQVLDLPTRPDVTVRIAALMPDKPRAAVILLAGGDGGLHLFPNGTTMRLGGNFLVRSHEKFAQHGLAAVLVDAPSDRTRPPYLRGFRLTEDHARDLASVVRWAAPIVGGKVWLVGTSRGTESAMSAALKLQGMPGLAGVVLSSSILSESGSASLLDLPIDALRLPLLVIHHELDTCRVSRFTDLGQLTQRLPASAPHKVVTVKGGSTTGDACQGMAHHGFNGREDDAVREIADWIARH
jgi:pimeloyl-ACP methyl ester carboxylesterase